MRALGQNPTNKDVKAILGNPSPEGKSTTYNFFLYRFSLMLGDRIELKTQTPFLK